MTETTDFSLPLRVRAAMYFRLLAVQGSWNYETLLGTGVGFVMEPALRLLPGGTNGGAYRSALARESRYFNAHPYLAGVAVGALTRAELDGVDPTRIERFRTALAGPLGSVGDRLVWASWLPFCSLVAIGVFGAGGSALAVVGTFLLLYNAGHFLLRAWGLRIGLSRGLNVASALGNPVLRQGPDYIGRAAALMAGVALPLALQRIAGPGRALAGGIIVAALIGILLLAGVRERAEGWRIALGVLAVFVLYSVLT
ncbi:MAG TPA: PTS system mannose/fructose/sorbose family transporter subunit IID [Gemmatimonadaceae bacterium]|jgi:PTS system mannose-specific IID component|nr:PTS system mannose/fructose/sorbose family transporter subunit IID [Gemmatimonadaceae bacterium]